MNTFRWSFFTVLTCVFFGLFQGYSQESLSLEEFLAYVKRYHPFVKQANITLSQSQAKLLKARGAFDPSFEMDFKEKIVKNSPYYERLNAVFSLPTPLGIDVKAEVSEAVGAQLNPERFVSSDQLYAVGAELDLGKGLLANSRTIALKKAKQFINQAEEENRVAINQILEQATHAFIEWYAAYQQWQLVGKFVENANFRFKGVKKRVIEGDLAPIDSVEARIAFNNRVLLQEKSRLKLNIAVLKASNFLWIMDQPLEIKPSTTPIVDESTFTLNFTPEVRAIEGHPKLRALEYKIAQAQLEQRLQRNNLLPEVKLGYRWLSDQIPTQMLRAALDPENNITSVKVKFPLFLRKERAGLKIASLIVDDLTQAKAQAKLDLTNKMSALEAQKNSLINQKEIAKDVMDDYRVLYEGEQKKFNAGESSLFLVNSRESRYLDAVQKFIFLKQDQQKTQLSYYFLRSFQEYP